MTTITIKGVKELSEKLDRASRNDVLVPPMHRAVMRIQRVMATYPPQRAGSRYIRTGTLGRKWTTKVTASQSGVRGKVGNNTPYGPFVQSSQFQASIHRGRWQTDESVVDKNRAAIIAEFERAINAVLK